MVLPAFKHTLLTLSVLLPFVTVRAVTYDLVNEGQLWDDTLMMTGEWEAGVEPPSTNASALM